MSFDIARTPTLQAVATEDPQRLVEDLQDRLDAAVRQADELPEVMAAATAERQAGEHLAKLKRAERALTQSAKELAERMTASRETALDAIAESAACGVRPDFKPLNELATLESRRRHITRAIQRLVETSIPLAELTRLREESHAAMAKARAIERMAQERAEKVMEQLREAVSEEMVLPVDMSKGVSGALLAYAAEFKSRAIQVSENADQIEKRYRARV